MRRANLGGVYDVHTNIMQYPKIMQPTHARWERVPPAPAATSAELTTNMDSLNLNNGGSPSGTEIKKLDETRESHETATGEASAKISTTTFKPVPAHLHDRYVIQDIVYESPQYSNMGIPGPDGDVLDVGPNGLVSVANPTHPEFMTPEIMELLPPECKEALIEAAAQEVEWKSRWTTETQDGERTQPTKSYAWYP
jgi:chromatin structure-remodeling complex protein RSC7